MVITENQKQDLIDRIEKAVRPQRIILFGSSAREQADSHSDIDLLVIVPEGTHRRRAAQSIYKNLLGFGTGVDIVVATPSDLKNYQDSRCLIYREALREGIDLYAA